MSASECFADGGTVLVAGGRDATTLLATPAETIEAASLEALHELGRGMVLLALEETIASRLELTATGHRNRGKVDLPFTTTIDATRVVDGGWSLRDRALTMRVAAGPATTPDDVRIPGHVHPLRVRPTQLLDDGADAVAASLELARQCSKRPAVALCLVSDRAGCRVSLKDARAKRGLSRLPAVAIDDLRAAHRAARTRELAVTCLLPTRDGDFTAAGYVSAANGDAMIALIHGDPANRPYPRLHVHAGCLFGDVFGSLMCDCRRELDAALSAIASDGAGVLLYGKPDVTQPWRSCRDERRLDAPVAAGLLRRIGLRSATITGTASGLAAKLPEFGVDAREGPGYWSRGRAR